MKRELSRQAQWSRGLADLGHFFVALGHLAIILAFPAAFLYGCYASSPWGDW